MSHQTIAILHFAGPPLVGGVEQTIAAHARVMAADGHTVRIVAGSGGQVDSRVTTLLDPLLSSRGPEIEQVNAELARGEVTAAFHALVNRIAAALATMLAGADVAMVHNVLTLHKNLAFTTALWRLHQAGRAPRLLAWCHDFAWLDPLYAGELHAGQPWDLLKTAWPGVRYIVVSRDRQAMLAGLLGVDETAIDVVTPGVDLAAFLKLEPETTELVQRLDLLLADPLLLLPARITRRKNIELAVAIVGGLRAQRLQPKLVVTGPPGPHNPTNAAYLAQLQALRDATGDPGSVVFLYETFTDTAGRPRPVGDAMIADLFRLADGLLFPSRYEGFGIPVLEAGLAGLPIFASNIAPFRETAGGAALLFDLDAPPLETAARIAQFLRNDQRTTLRRRVRLDYTWDAVYRREIVGMVES
ncbi:MAG: glycosyltransferase family 4 protein [Roseiflexaceae bacterium]|nr:glycosyltransferase family 4 protein [Roseiflexaceae bacterium]